MKHARPLFLAVSTLALLISACSQTDDLTSPAIEPQYGTALWDSAEQVAANEAGHLFALGAIRNWDPEFRVHEPVLKRFDAFGKELWSRNFGNQCPSQEANYACDVYLFNLTTDSIGNSYVLYGSNSFSESDNDSSLDVTLRKYSPVGNLQWTRAIVKQGRVSTEDGIKMAASAKGEVYVAYENSSYDKSQGYTTTRHLLKFNTRGEKLFDRSQSIEKLHDAAVGGDGSLYILGHPYRISGVHLTKYSSSGTLLWQRALPNYDDHLAVSGNSIYTVKEHASRTLSKYTTNGNLVWKRSMPPVGSNAAFDVDGLSADATGNAYLVGRTNTSSEDEGGDLDFFVRKYTPSGGVAWTYAPKLPGTYEVAHDISAGDSGKVYVVGTTNGKVNGKNYGGEDAFLIRLNGQGGRVWSR